MKAAPQPHKNRRFTCRSSPVEQFHLRIETTPPKPHAGFRCPARLKHTDQGRIRMCYKCAYSVRLVNRYGIRHHSQFGAAQQFRSIHGVFERIGGHCSDHLGETFRCRSAYRHADARTTGPCTSQHNKPLGGLRERAEVPSGGASDHPGGNRYLR